MILRSGGRVDATVAERTYGFTPLHEAVIGGHIEVVKWLCDKCDAGGDVNIPNKMGTSPLMNACHVGNLRMAKVEFVQKHKPLFIFFGVAEPPLKAQSTRQWNRIVLLLVSNNEVAA